MELKLSITNGPRTGHTFVLRQRSEAPSMEIPWILDDETLQFEIVVSKQCRSAVLELYQHSIQHTLSSNIDSLSDTTIFIWTPTGGKRTTTNKLFWNYFGVAELNVLLSDEDGEIVEFLSFQPIQVITKKSSAIKIEEMFEYLASISNEVLHSVFSATRHTIGFEEGTVSPSHTYERLENAVVALRELLPHVLHSPITRLVPEHKLTPLNGREELDDSSIGWLVENLSILQPTDHPSDAHVYYDGDHFKASALLMPVLQEQADVYENRIIHGFIDQLIRTAQSLVSRMESEMSPQGSSANIPNGYVSFFEKMSSFKSLLMGSHINKIYGLLHSLKHYKTLLSDKLYVKRSVLDRPIVTPKAQCRPAYRNLFIEIIKWHDKGKIDWSAYETLFAIESVPVLFESYSYFRVLEIANRFLDNHNYDKSRAKDRCFKSVFIDKNDSEIEIIKEPIYWTIKHDNRNPNYIVNSEAFTVYKENRLIRHRSQTGSNSKRIPDIVIQIKRASGTIKLLVLDAKYTYATAAFIDYLPDLTLKYVHGIHRIGQSDSLVSSMSIIYPDDKAGFRCFHYGSLGVFGENPVSPSLQSCGIILGKDRNTDGLERLIIRLLQIEGVQPMTPSADLKYINVA